MEVNVLVVEEGLFTMAALWGRRSVNGKMEHEQQKSWRQQIFEVQTWKQVRGPAGAIMSRNSDLVIKWPQWHVLILRKRMFDFAGRTKRCIGLQQGRRHGETRAVPVPVMKKKSEIRSQTVLENGNKEQKGRRRTGSDTPGGNK